MVEGWEVRGWVGVRPMKKRGREKGEKGGMALYLLFISTALGYFIVGL